MTSSWNNRSAFTLIELLAVIAIIGILAGMIGSAAYAARQESYRAQAVAETREIANACRAYWMVFSSWPGSSGPILLNGDVYKALVGDGNGTHTGVFLEFDETRFDESDGYLDPWGNPYEITFDSVERLPRTQKFSSSVTFPMRYRYKYYGTQFNTASGNSGAEFEP